jgi:hypothetical protein
MLPMDEGILLIDWLESDKDAKGRIINYLQIPRNQRTDYRVLTEIFSC